MVLNLNLMNLIYIKQKKQNNILIKCNKIKKSN